jgi:hypothetical protein
MVECQAVWKHLHGLMLRRVQMGEVMTNNDLLQQLISKAVVDVEFREQLFADPIQAASTMGFELSEEDIVLLKRLTPVVFDGTDEQVDERVTKMGIWLIP